jgi:hypothetical protein
VRRWTLITIIVLVLILAAAAIYQVLVAQGERRFPGGPPSPASAP